MKAPNLLIFYVQDPLKSAKFYKKIFKADPSFEVPSWVSFSFENGLHFALWSENARDFKSSGHGHRSELSFMVDTEAEVKEIYENWKTEGVQIEQEIHKAVFGPTFVALDPDGHRIRVCIPD